MSTDKYQLVEEDYDAVDLSFHNSYNTIEEYKTQVGSFIKHITSGKSLLNAGGTASECSYFADQGWSVTNVDISQVMLNHIAEADIRIKTDKANIVDYKHAPFDALWACRSLIHIPPEDLPKALQNIRLLLASSGIFGCIFFTAQEESKEEYLKEPNTQKEGIIYYRVLYSPSYLTNQFKKNGYKVLKQELCVDRDGEESVYFEISKL